MGKKSVAACGDQRHRPEGDPNAMDLNFAALNDISRRACVGESPLELLLIPQQVGILPKVIGWRRFLKKRIVF